MKRFIGLILIPGLTLAQTPIPSSWGQATKHPPIVRSALTTEAVNTASAWVGSHTSDPGIFRIRHAASVVAFLVLALPAFAQTPLDFLRRTVPVNSQGEITAPTDTRTMALSEIALRRSGQTLPPLDLRRRFLRVTVPGKKTTVLLLPVQLKPGPQSAATDIVFSGDAAWGGIVEPLQTAQHRYRGSKVPPNAPELETVLQTVRSLIDFQAPNGGIYFAPQETLDQINGHPEDISNAHMITIYRSFEMFLEFLRLHDLTDAYAQDVAQVKATMQKMADYFFTIAFDPKTMLFAAGGYSTPEGDGFIVNTNYATDAQPLDLDFALIDKRLGPGMSYYIWDAIKKQAGYFEGDTLKGMGLVKGNNPHTGMTRWALSIAKRLAHKYQGETRDLMEKDIAGLEAGLAQLKTATADGSVYVEAKAKQAAWWGGEIGDGPAAASTAEVILGDHAAFIFIKDSRFRLPNPFRFLILPKRFSPSQRAFSIKAAA